MSAFRCPRCGEVFVLPTRMGRFRGKGHVKSLWCWKCKRSTPHKLL